MDKHFIKEKLDRGLICTPYVSNDRHFVDILTKCLNSTKFQASVSKRMENIYSQALEGVWKNKIKKVVILWRELGNPVIKEICCN